MRLSTKGLSRGADLAALQSELLAAKVELHRVRVIDQFRTSERDYNVPLQ
jgi:hypothetical protein